MAELSCTIKLAIDKSQVDAAIAEFETLRRYLGFCGPIARQSLERLAGMLCLRLDSPGVAEPDDQFEMVDVAEIPEGNWRVYDSDWRVCDGPRKSAPVRMVPRHAALGEIFPGRLVCVDQDETIDGIELAAGEPIHLMLSDHKPAEAANGLASTHACCCTMETILSTGCQCGGG